MRKFVALAACLILFTACKAKDAPVVLENPQATFNELSTTARDSLKDSVLGLLPEMEVLQKSKSTFALKGKANMDTAGSIDFDFNAAGEADTTNKEDPLMKSSIDASAVVDGEPFKGNASASLELIVANASVFMSLKDLKVDFPSYPTSEILDPIKQHLGKWYGDTFTSLNEQTGTDIKETYLNRMNNPAELREKIGQLISETDLFTMKSFIAEENGFDKFDVELNKAELRSFVEGIMNLSATSEAEKQKSLADFDKKMETVTVTGTLAFKKDDAKFFTFDGKTTDTADAEKNGTIVASVLETGKSLVINNTKGGVNFSMEKQGDNNAFSIKQTKAGEAEKEIAKGTISATAIDATIYNPDSASDNIKIALTKSVDAWSGSITGYESPTAGTEGDAVKTIFTMEISNLTVDKNNFKADLLLKDKEGKELANLNINYHIEATDSVSIVSPESFDQFSTLLQNFLPFMMMGAQGIDTRGGAGSGSLGGEGGIDIPSPGIPSGSPGSDEAIPTSPTETQAASDGQAVPPVEIKTDNAAGVSVPLSDLNLPPDVAADVQKQLEDAKIKTE